MTLMLFKCNTTQQTDNNIGAEGARLMSEALKTNTTLTTLNLSCEQGKTKRQCEWHDDVVQMQHNTTQQTGNRIGAEGAGLMSEALKTNTTLTTLNLGSEQEDKTKRQCE